MIRQCTAFPAKRKISLLCSALFILGACSVNPATGQKQFTAFMSPQQELSVGQQEHPKILAAYGGLVKDKALAAYVSTVGQSLTPYTERPDVRYQFFVLDSPVVNAFALPGGYVYITRGLMAVANSEAELAAVLGHEIAHITARHSAERYSQSVLANLGTTLLSVAVDSPSVARAAQTGAGLYLNSYSRGQESEADTVGLRYLTQAGYTPYAMAWFLEGLAAYSALEGDPRANSEVFEIFSTHPLTSKRIADATELARAYPQSGKVNQIEYMKQIEGMTFGDSPSQGFIRGNQFFHPELDFTFTVPSDFKIDNQPSRVIAVGPNDTGIIFDADEVKNTSSGDPASYVFQNWLKGEKVTGLETITVNGKPGATAAFTGFVNGKKRIIRVVAVQWKPGLYYRFQLAMPENISQDLLVELQRTTYSLRPMTTQEKQQIKPLQISVAAAGPDTKVRDLVGRMVKTGLPADPEKTFRALNGLGINNELRDGRLYKIIK